VISPNGLLSSLGVCQHQDESNPFLFAKKKSTHHVLFEQRQNFKVILRFRTSLLRALRSVEAPPLHVCSRQKPIDFATEGLRLRVLSCATVESG
jgi:hypothetical protein